MTIILTPIADTTRDSYMEAIRALVKDKVSIPSISLSKAAGGDLSAGTVNVRVSAVTEFGETLPSTRVSLAVVADDKVTVTIGRCAEAKFFRVYASTGTNVETLQAEVDQSQKNAVHVIEAISSGSAMPTVDTATIHCDRDDYIAALESAVGEYSGNFPQELDETITLTTNLNYALPVTFVDGFSSVRKVIYPGDSSPEDWLDQREYTARAGYLYLEDALIAGSTIKVRYTALHVVSQSQDTIPVHHNRAVCLLAASNICLQIAVKYSHNSNKTIGADTVDYKMRADDFRKNGGKYRSEAEDILGLTNGIAPASHNASWGWYENR